MPEVVEAETRFHAPGPMPPERDPSPLVQLRQTLRNPISAFPRAVYEQPVYRRSFPGQPVYLMDPAAIRAVLVEHAAHFPQGALFARMLRPVWGQGLLTAEGPEWRWQRHAAAPAFRPAHIAALTPRMRAPAESALARWREAGPDVTFDIAQETAQITFEIILDTVLSGGEDIDRGTARARIGAFMAQLAPIKLSYLLAPDAFHAGRGSTGSAEAKALRVDVDHMVARRRSAAPRGDLVDLMMGTTDPQTGRPMDDVTLRDNLLGFIVAGHETSATALAWCLYLLSQDDRVATRVREDVEQVTSGGPVEADHVERLVYVRQVVSEAMRLYPPAHTITRVCTRTTEVAGTTIRRGTRVIVPIYALHRHRLWWRDPDLFDPDRFAPDAPPIDRHVYMPFGAGPRICLGAAFATTELVVVLATLVRSARFRLVPGHKVWPVGELALRPEGGLPMRITVA